eukprot:9944196-Lingulodinium_polyedra.AAC.1
MHRFARVLEEWESWIDDDKAKFLQRLHSSVGRHLAYTWSLLILRPHRSADGITVFGDSTLKCWSPRFQQTSLDIIHAVNVRCVRSLCVAS